MSLVFLVGLVLAIGDPALIIGDYSRLRMVLGLPLLGVALSAASVASALLGWRRGFWSLPAQLHYTAVALASVGLTWFIAVWNLLGIRL